MHLSVLQDVFAEALSKTVRAIDSRPTLPVLANVLLEAGEAGLRITATNQEASICTTIGAQVLEAGSITVDAKNLQEIVTSMSGSRVEMEIVPNLKLKIVCGKAKFSLAGIGAEEFPPTPEVNVKQQVRIKFEDLDWLIRRTLYAVSKETHRPAYMGVTLRFSENVLSAQSMDGYHGAVAQLPIEDGWKGEYIVPAKTLEYAQKVFESDYIHLALGEINRNQHLILDDGQVNVRSLLISGNITNIETAPGRTERNVVRVETEAFRAMLRRAHILGRDVGHQAYLDFIPEQGGIQVTLSKSERGEFDELVPAEFDGEGFQTMLDLNRVNISITSMQEHAMLEFLCNGGGDAFIIRPVDETTGDSFALMMPLDPKKPATASATTATMPAT